MLLTSNNETESKFFLYYSCVVAGRKKISNNLTFSVLTEARLRTEVLMASSQFKPLFRKKNALFGPLANGCTHNARCTKLIYCHQKKILQFIQRSL